MASNDDNNWRTAAFRQSVVQKIDEAIQKSGMPTNKKGSEMEVHVFQKAKSKEEYLGFVARLILHVRELNSKKGGGMNSPAGQNMQDPINALQTLARQGTGNQMGGPGLAGPMVAPQMAPNTMQNQMGTPQMGGQMHNGQLGMTLAPPPPMAPQQPSNPNLMQALNPRQMLQQKHQQTGQVMMPGAGPMVQPPPISSATNLGPQRKPVQDGGMGVGMAGSGYMQGHRGVAPQYLRQSPTPPGASPITGYSQMVPSPALVPSPSNPQLAATMQTNIRSLGMTPSPGCLNTPGQAVTASPCGTVPEEVAYREKIRQLSRYIEPLRRMTARVGNDDHEKLSKMKSLLDILTNPTKRTPLETLLKCEVVLEKLDFKRQEGSGQPVREQHPLIETLRNHLQSPVINHTLQRTFGPCTEALFGSDIKMPALPKRKKIEESSEDIPEVLQGEIARLDQRFKVSLDPSGAGTGSKSVQLVCWLDDRHLPSVPPVWLTVPSDYPASPPKCHLPAHTTFLSKVKDALTARLHHLPPKYTVSQLLDTWEMSVRYACAPAKSS